MVTCLFFSTMLWACGKKGPPRAPELALPKTITDLRARARKDGVGLNWSRPVEYIDGKRLEDLAAFVIFRKTQPAGCPHCPSPYREIGTVNVEDQAKFLQQERYGFVDAGVQPDETYRYRVFSRLFDGSLSEPSNEVIIQWKP